MRNPKKSSSKRGFLGLIFNRTFIVILLLLVQVGFLFSIVTWLQSYVVYIYGVFIALTFISVVYIINKPGNPSFKLAWIVPISIFPIAGILLYAFIEISPSTKILDKLHQEQIERTKPLLKQSTQTLNQLEIEAPLTAGMAKYISSYGGYPICQNTEVTYFPLGEDKFKEMLVQLKKAKHFIFLEYFIIQNGIMWESILNILKEKAKEGVEVRLMYDGTCSIVLLPWHYPEELAEYGIKCKIFSPIKPVLSTHLNNRDHRKILVIDGEVAFNGGVNLADEYINQKQVYGHWKDTAVMLRGDAVKNLTMMFLQMWNIASRSVEPYEKYLLADGFAGVHSGYVCPYGDSPVDGEHIGELVYLHLLQTAKHYVHIMTPYLILDHEMITEMKYAAKRGVDVHIIMPHIPDKWYAFVLAHSYYPELLQAGVKISEYTPGFVHAKVFVTDDIDATVGTINLDFRSLYLHFECATFMHDVPAVADIETDFQNTLSKSQAITMEDYKNFSLFSRFAGAALKLLAPLM